jgi:hypothetical protein
MKPEYSFLSIGGRVRPQIKSTICRLLGRCRIPAMILAAAVTASTIGLAPPAAAKGIVLPRVICSGPELAARTCEPKHSQVVSAATLSPRKSKWHKIAKAIERQERIDSKRAEPTR